MVLAKALHQPQRRLTNGNRSNRHCVCSACSLLGSSQRTKLSYLYRSSVTQHSLSRTKHRPYLVTGGTYYYIGKSVYKWWEPHFHTYNRRRTVITFTSFHSRL